MRFLIVAQCRFDDLTRFLRQESTVTFSKKCVERIHRLCVLKHGCPAEENVNVRVFLSAYMIAYFPHEVFDRMEQIEKDLISVTMPLIEVFERICGAISESRNFCDTPSEMTESFPALLLAYMRQFKVWKVPDEARLVQRIQHGLLSLYEARSHLPPDEPDDSVLNTEFRVQIGRLRGKLAQVAGNDFLQKFDNDRQVQNFSEPALHIANELLAHELLIDATFQLDDTCDYIRKIQTTFHPSFWKCLEDDLKFDRPCYFRALRVLDDVRCGILELTRSQEAVSTIFDNIKERIESFTWVEAFDLICSVVELIKRFQSPKRDTETFQRFSMVMQERADCPAAFYKGLELILDRINVMRIDAANHRLRLIAPVIRDHGIDYERGKFQDKLNAGALTLTKTKAWIRNTLNSGDPRDVVSEAVLSIVSNSEPLTVLICPETILLDLNLVRSIQLDFAYIAASAAVLIRCCHILERIDDVMRLSILLANRMDIGQAVQRTFYGSPDIQIAVQQSLNKDDPLFKIMCHRVRIIFADVIKNGNTPDGIPRVVSNLTPLIMRSASILKRVVDVTNHVHGPTYSAIVDECLKTHI